MLQRYYRLTTLGRCEEAAGVVLGHAVRRCRRLERAEPGAVESKNLADGRKALSFTLAYRKRGARPAVEQIVAPLVFREGGWLADLDHARRSRLSRAPKVQPAAAPAGPKPPAGLLSLWTAQELAGRPGDERITPLRKARLGPPASPAPSAKLPELPQGSLASIRSVRLPPGRKWVALTFDLCERADEVTGYDRGIVNTLRARGAKATFFAGGKWLESHPEKALQLMADPLFELGNHAWTHGNLRVLKGQELEDQIVWTQAEHERLWQQLRQRAARRGLSADLVRLPPLPRVFRFPYGTCSEEALRTVNRFGLAAVQWDVVSGDPGGIAPTRRIVEAVRPGSIVVLHANGRGKGTARALPGLLDALARKGFQFVTVSELLAAGTPETVGECYELKPGDNARYDALFGAGTERPERPLRAAARPKPPTPPTGPGHD
jgi:peptidoglycan/xylan/chitin deacetylase (PgdA/CDA1 family)